MVAMVCPRIGVHVEHVNIIPFANTNTVSDGIWAQYIGRVKVDLFNSPWEKQQWGLPLITYASRGGGVQH